ncbi:hypothetical protein THIOSC13_1040009 [uncultured Thiomicrorhabdus sp.]
MLQNELLKNLLVSFACTSETEKNPAMSKEDVNENNTRWMVKLLLTFITFTSGYTNGNM